MEGDIDDLAEANKGIGLPSGQTYLTDEYGGLNRYKAYKAKRDQEGQTSVQPDNNINEPKKVRQYKPPVKEENNVSS